jgi:aryl-alcohol dehydrogenase-like predicted oxidoreductase
MKIRTLGSSELAVSSVGMGCMYLSIRDRPSEDDAVRTLHAALDGGVTLLDTADVYCLDHRDIGHNERLIARALRERKGASVAATKGAGAPERA